jgi:anti-sigma regulatory factor (Ser/Thr protein kinase)
MSGSLHLDWAILVSSFVNLILLLWLGLIVFFSAEERTLGVWLVGGAALLGAGFFVAHTTILAIGASVLARSLEFWWRLGWWPLIIIPPGWYFMTLWYAGFWDKRGAQVRQRHRWLVWLAAGLVIALITLFLLRSPLPSFEQVVALQFEDAPSLFGVPLLLLAYPLATILCIGLALDALLHPAPSTHALGKLAHARAQPWLIATSATLLIVSLLVALLIGVIVMGNQPLHAIVHLLSWADLLIAWLITLATVLVGQAVVSYEIFTGRTLPRGDLHRHWRYALLLALGYGLVVGGSIAWNLRPIYSVLLSTLLMTGFLALSSWRAIARHEDFVRRLRPFVAARQPERQLSGPEIDVNDSFLALCSEVLRSDRAVLAAGPPLSSLLPPLYHPPATLLDPQAIARVVERVTASDSPLVHVEDPALPLLRWAIPLHDSRGQAGALLVGKRFGDALFTQEEVETARAVAERLLDGRASHELMQRLLTVQRQRLAEIRVLDQQARRILHDEALPNVHTALLLLAASNDPAAQEASPLLEDVHHRLANLLRNAPRTAATELSAGLLAGVRQVLDGELAGQFDRISWMCDASAEDAGKELPSLTVEVAFYAVRELLRNAARHARGDDPRRRIHLAVEFRRAGNEFRIEVADDGVGMGEARASEGSPTDRGLALHGALLSMVQGRLELHSNHPQGTRAVVLLA